MQQRGETLHRALYPVQVPAGRKTNCLALLLAFAISVFAGDQTFAQNADAYDRGLRERNASDSDRDFSIKLTLPLLFTTSVLAANSDGTVIEKQDKHFFPDLQAKWSHQFDQFRMTAYGAISSDRYFEVSSADVNVIEGGLLAELTNGKSDLFIPYFSYTARTFLDGDFRSLHDQRHDFAVGVFSGIGWRDGETIRYSDAVKAGDQSLGLDVQTGRRVANVVDREHTFVTVAVDYTYTFTQDFWVVLGPKIRVRWYDDFFDQFRRDVRFSVTAKAVWKPEWLTQMLPHSELAFTVEYFNNSSTDDFNDYSLWELGPSLRLTTKF